MAKSIVQVGITHDKNGKLYIRERIRRIYERECIHMKTVEKFLKKRYPTLKIINKVAHELPTAACPQKPLDNRIYIKAKQDNGLRKVITINPNFQSYHEKFSEARVQHWLSFVIEKKIKIRSNFDWDDKTRIPQKTYWMENYVKHLVEPMLCPTKSKCTNGSSFPGFTIEELEQYCIKYLDKYIQNWLLVPNK